MKGGWRRPPAAALRFIAKGRFARLDQLSHHRRRGRPVDQRQEKLIRWALARGERFDHCIVGEPTSVGSLGDTIKHGRRGSLTGRLDLPAAGPCRLPAVSPEQSDPALGADALGAVHPPLDHGDADFDPSNLEVVSVDVGNLAANVIPAEVRLVFNVRFNDLWTPETLSAEIARRVEAAAEDRAIRSPSIRQRRRLPDPARRIHRPRRRRGRGRDRTSSVLFDRRRHVRCAFHQGRLPGRRPRPAERDHSRDRRAGRARRSRGPELGSTSACSSVISSSAPRPMQGGSVVSLTLGSRAAGRS